MPSTTTTLMTKTATRSPSARSTATALPPPSSTARLSVVSSSTAAPPRSPSTTRTTPHRAPPSTRAPPNTYAIPPRPNTQPLQLNLNRSTSIELSAAPIRKGPLIFAAMAIGQGQVASIGQQENLSPNQNPNSSTNQRTSVIQLQNALAGSQRQQAPIINHQQAPTFISSHDNSVNATCISAPSARRVVDHNHGTHSYPSPPAEYISLDRAGGRVNVPSVPSTERTPVPLSAASTSTPFGSDRVGLVRGGSERINASTQGQGQGRVLASGPVGYSPFAFEAGSGTGRRVSLDVGSGRSSDAVPPPSRLRVSSDASARMPPPPPAPMRKLNRATSKESLKPRVLTKSRPPTPSSSTSTPSAPAKLVLKKVSMEALFSEDTLFLEEDPFKKVEGVQVVKMCGSEEGTVRPVTPSRPKSPLPLRPKSPMARPKSPMARPKSPLTPDSPDVYKSARTQRRGQWLEKTRPPLVADVIAQQEVMSKEAELLQEEEDVRLRKAEEVRRKEEEARQREEEERMEKEAEEKRLKEEAEEKQRLEEELARKPPTFYPIVSHLADGSLLPHLLAYMTFGDWCALYAANKEVRVLFESRVLREYVLEHFLRTVGYRRWSFEWAEPLALSLKVSPPYLPTV
ncbi:hypothetical protein BDR03DRAFT_139118 [Suillus americanus]|nr:hypothetical protein BDR03DRAFT_139118 [Suillus americanus]